MNFSQGWGGPEEVYVLFAPDNVDNCEQPIKALKDWGIDYAMWLIQGLNW